MNCFTRINVDMKKCNVSRNSTFAEQQIHTTDLESISPNIGTSLQTTDSSLKILEPKMYAEKSTLLLDNKTAPTYYFFSRKKRKSIVMPTSSPMRRSKKSTNLVKYKNSIEEPRLKEPLDRCLLIRKPKSRSPRKNETKLSHRGVACDVPKENNEVQVGDVKEHKSMQDLKTVSEYDRITEHLMISLFENHKITHNSNNKEVKYYINQVVKELYDIKVGQSYVHPVKLLFRSLLEYWLKNTTGDQFKEAMRRVKSVHKPSIEHFTRDKILSSFLLGNATKQTQFHGISDFTNDYEVSQQLPTRNVAKSKLEKKAIRCHSPKRDTESFEKERRIQELERILKNTVYVCETVRSNQSKEKDIKITKKLIDNLEKWSKRSGLNNVFGENLENSNSSSEVPKIQETINHLISETSLPPDVAKEFLNAYLGTLLNDSSKSMTQSSSQSSEQVKTASPPPNCDVQAESVQKRLSKNITTANLSENPIRISYTDGDQSRRILKNNPDSGELYLKGVLDKITTVFSKDNKEGKNIVAHNNTMGDHKNEGKHKISKSVKEFPGKNLIHENHDENSLVIDLSKYKLERISMFSDPSLRDVMSITIKLKEKPPDLNNSNKQKLSVKFCNESNPSERLCSDDWLHNIDSHSLKKIFDPIDVLLNPNLNDYNYNLPKDALELQPYISSNESTPTAYCQIVHESEHSIDLSFKSSNFFKKEYTEEPLEDTQPCFIVSSLKKNSIESKSQSSKKKVHMKRNNNIVLGPQIRSPIQSTSSRYPDEYSIFEQPTPKIIDEKFILLLLENLTLLSKNLPSLFKDIKTLYLKLRKKHEKIVRNCGNIQGLSLLGRIYNDDFKPNDRCTQYEEAESNHALSLCKTDNTGVSTSSDCLSQKNVIDRPLSTCNLKALSRITEVQTEDAFDIKSKAADSNKEILSESSSSEDTMSSHSIRKELSTVERATSNPNWDKQVPTKNCAVSTIIRVFTDYSDDVRKFTMARSKNFENVQRIKTDKVFRSVKVSKLNREQSADVRKELNKGLTLLSRPLKISAHSQTDTIFLFKSNDLKTASEFNPCNEFNVYQLFLSTKEPQMSNSMIDLLSVSKERSDDLKTIYRCNSEPSYSSGLNHTFI